MRRCRLLVPGLLAVAAAGWSPTAQAKPDAIQFNEKTARFMVYGSPVFFAAPIGDDDAVDAVDVSYQWGFGLGGLFAVGPKRNFGIGVGFGFEHNPATLDDDFADACDFVNADCSIHAFRFLPELRLGALIKQLYAYGYIAPGFAFTYGRYDGVFADDEDTDPGFNFGLGGGVQYVVWRGLFVGGEFGFDLGRYTNNEDDIGDDNYGVYLIDLKALIGWYF